MSACFFILSVLCDSSVWVVVFWYVCVGTGFYAQLNSSLSGSQRLLDLNQQLKGKQTNKQAGTHSKPGTKFIHKKQRNSTRNTHTHLHHTHTQTHKCTQGA